MGNQLRRAAVGAFVAAAALMTGSASAQFDSENISLHSQIDVGTFGASRGNDCWGYVSPSGREYALMGLDNKVAFVEITDPANPDWFASVNHSSSTWGDVKVYQDHAYVVTEASGSGIQVIDLSDIDNHNVTLVRTISSPGRSHNVAIDTASGFLYTCGSREGAAFTVIFDLSDPANPQQVGTWDGDYQHDIQAVTYTEGPNAGRQILFGSSEGRGLDIVDVTDKSNPFFVSRTPYPNLTYCHQAWTEDLQYIYINDELDSIPRNTVIDISDIENPQPVGEFSSGLQATDHNGYVRDGLLFQATYHAGLRVWDLNADPLNPPQIGWFDTYPSDDGAGFDGAWSCYPFFPSGTVIVSDINRGLFVLDVSQLPTGRLAFEYPSGRPDLIDPAGGTTMEVLITATGDANAEPGTGVLHVDTGSGFAEFPMTDLGGGLYEATFPASTCGTQVEYFVSAETTEGDVFTDPAGAPGAAHETLSANGLDIVFEDDFETNEGWTVENFDLEDGAWERGVPAGDGTRGDPTSDFDGSGRCYLTDNVAGNSDVDGGPTRLLSPIIDLSSDPDAVISYARWFSNDDGDGDRLDVHVSNDGGGSWTLVESVGNTGGWSTHQFTVADFVAPTSQVRVRFSATDNPNDSVTEAAIDAFEVSSIICGPDTQLAGFSVDVGTLLEGELSDLQQSDDAHVHTRSGFGETFAELHKLEMVVNASTTANSPSTIDLTIESRIDEPNGTAKVSLRNWDTGDFETVESYSIGTTEEVVTIENIDASTYVSGSGEIDVQVKHVVFVPCLAFTFDSFFDEVRLQVN